MISSRTEARDAMLTLIKTVVDAQSITTAIWDDVEKQRPDEDTEEWIRVMVRHRRGSRSSLGRKDGTGKHTQTGFLMIEIFTQYDDGLTRSDVLSQAFASAIRGANSSDMWYKNVAELEVGRDSVWWKTDVVAEFEYDLIQ